MTREEETNERNACDEWFHERGGASIHEAWIEATRRAKVADYASLHMTPEQAAKEAK